jgi:hypothetical protein
VSKVVQKLKTRSFKKDSFSKKHLVIFSLIFALIGGYIVFRSFAAGPTVSLEAENSSANSPATTVSDAQASGGSALKFRAPGSCPVATHNVPDGPDPWGGCWPGPKTTGYPHGLAGDTRTPVTLTNYTGSVDAEGDCIINTAVALNAKRFNCNLIIQAKVTITNSLINGQIYIDSDNPATQNNLNWFLTLQNSEVNTGLVELPVVYEGAIALDHDDIHGGVTSVQCGDKAAQCVIHDSYLHGQLIQVNSTWHLGGFHSIGGTNYDLTHNYVTCDQPATYPPDGGCSGDIVFIPTPPLLITHALINKNFLGANPAGAYCLYGGDRPPDLFATYMTITNNIFARGSNGKCDAFGPVAGTNTGSTNVWSGNVWEDGGTILPEE